MKLKIRNSKLPPSQRYGVAGEVRNSIGFTLFEIMLAVGILGMMSLAIFRFV